MHLHHLLPPPHAVGFVLTAGLAFAAGALLVSRRKWSAALATTGTNLKSHAAAWRGASSNIGAPFAKMFSKCANARSDRWNSSGNTAFDEYRSATLTELEQEAAAFRKYLDELRHAKDKSEFDAFLNERRRTPTNETSSP